MSFFDKFIIKSCCCGLAVKTGSFVIAILEIIGGIGQAIQLAIQKEQIENYTYASQISSIVIGILLSLCLLYGVMKENKYFVLPWVICTGIGICILTIAIVATIILAFTNAAVLVATIILILVEALLMYFWCCVYSYYRELTNPEFSNNQYP